MSFYASSGSVSAAEQAEIAYREMRRSLVEYAAIEAEIAERTMSSRRTITPTEENILSTRLAYWKDRAMMFAAIYHVERSMAQK